MVLYKQCFLSSICPYCLYVLYITTVVYQGKQDSEIFGLCCHPQEDLDTAKHNSDRSTPGPDIFSPRVERLVDFQWG